MSDRLLRSKVLNAVYKNKADVIAACAPQLERFLVEEALDVACDYCHPECAQILLKCPHGADIGSLIYKTMGSDNIARQNDMLEVLLPLLPNDECEWVAELACESFWPNTLSPIFERLPESSFVRLNMQWAATQGDVATIERLMDEKDVLQLNRILFFAAAAEQWNVCSFLVPLCDHFTVLYDLQEENRTGRFSRTIERLKEIVEHHQNHCQNQTIMSHIPTSKSHSNSRKI